MEQDIKETVSTSSNIEIINIQNEKEETVIPIVSTSMAKETIYVPLNTVDVKKILEESEKIFKRLY